MRQLLIIAALVLAGCRHAKQAEKPDEPAVPTQQEEARQAPKPKEQKAAPEAKQATPEDGRPQLSSDAEGLLQPDGPKLIQQALTQKGYLPRDHQTGELDAETATALRRFQADEHSPRTGYPDRETVRKLGLSVDKVFKSTR